MILSLSTGSLYIYPLRWIFSIAKRAGFDGVELVISPEVELRGGAYAKKLAQEFGLRIFSIHPPLYPYAGWKQLGRSIVPYLDRALGVSHAADAPTLVVHLPRARDTRSDIGRAFVDRLISEKKNLNGAGPDIALENRPRFRARDTDWILTTPEDLRGFADAHDFPLTLDTAHLGTFDLDLLEMFPHFRGRLANVHLSDLRDVSPRIEARPLLHSFVKQHQLPGAGKLPLRAFIATLAREQYAGPVTFELSPTALSIWNPRTAEIKLKQCVEFVQASITL